MVQIVTQRSTVFSRVKNYLTTRSVHPFEIIIRW